MNKLIGIIFFFVCGVIIGNKYNNQIVEAHEREITHLKRLLTDVYTNNYNRHCGTIGDQFYCDSTNFQTNK